MENIMSLKEILNIFKITVSKKDEKLNPRDKHNRISKVG